MDSTFRVVVKWSGKEYQVDSLSPSDTVGTLKDVIRKLTGVLPERQKLLNLKHKGKTPDDEVHLSAMNMKPGFKIMMMGSLEEEIEAVSLPPEDLPDVVNDFDIPEGEEVDICNREVYLSKITKRISDYKIVERNPPRQGKKLLVLDIDYTLFDHRSPAETGYELMRPYLHEFLTEAYKDYDIVIWSATSMKWIEEKMKLLGVATNPAYKITFYVDYLAMITVHTPKYGVVNVKPLGVIWGKYPEYYSPKNTIMFDDIRRNFLMNPSNGLRIRPFRQAHMNRKTDRELLKLTKYLVKISNVDDFSTLDHRHWERYLSDKHQDGDSKNE